LKINSKNETEDIKMPKNYSEAKCFIKSENGFEEITYDELLNRVDTDPSYIIKKFIPLHGMLMEVSQKEYFEFYKKQNRQKYLRLRSAKNGDVSIDMLTTDEFNGEDILVDYTQDVEAMAVKRMVIKKLYESISLLPEHEQKLIQEHFYLNISEVKLSEIYGVNQSTISRRINRIVNKLKKLMKI